MELFRVESPPPPPKKKQKKNSVVIIIIVLSASFTHPGIDKILSFWQILITAPGHCLDYLQHPSSKWPTTLNIVMMMMLLIMMMIDGYDDNDDDDDDLYHQNSDVTK